MEKNLLAMSMQVALYNENIKNQLNVYIFGNNKWHPALFFIFQLSID